MQGQGCYVFLGQQRSRKTSLISRFSLLSPYHALPFPSSGGVDYSPVHPCPTMYLLTLLRLMSQGHGKSHQRHKKALN